MKIREFDPKDLEAMCSGIQIDGITIPLDLYCQMVKQKDLAWSVIGDDEKVLGCGGVFPLWPKVGEAWTMLSNELKGNWFFLHRTVRRKLYETMKNHEFHRIQIMVSANFNKGCRWAEALGFKDEGVMHRYTTEGNDYRRYAIWQ